MFSFFSGLTDQIKLVIISVLITLLVVSVVGAWYYKSRYEHASEEVAHLRVEFQQVSTELNTCSGNIEKISNASVAKLEEAKKAMEAATEQAKKYQSISTKILTLQPSSPDSCVASLTLFRQYLSKEIK